MPRTSAEPYRHFLMSNKDVIENALIKANSRSTHYNTFYNMTHVLENEGSIIWGNRSSYKLIYDIRLNSFHVKSTGLH